MISNNNYYGIYDKTAESMAHVFQSANDNTAIRSFKILTEDKESAIAAKPEDYELRKLFIMDDLGNILDNPNSKISEGKKKENDE